MGSSKQATENEKYNELGNKKSFDRFYIARLAASLAKKLVR